MVKTQNPVLDQFQKCFKHIINESPPKCATFLALTTIVNVPRSLTNIQNIYHCMCTDKKNGTVIFLRKLWSQHQTINGSFFPRTLYFIFFFKMINEHIPHNWENTAVAPDFYFIQVWELLPSCPLYSYRLHPSCTGEGKWKIVFIKKTQRNIIKLWEYPEDNSTLFQRQAENIIVNRQRLLLFKFTTSYQ